MHRDKEFTPEQLEALISDNIVHRNELLNTVLGLLNSVEANTYFSLDGKWGSGKSVFIKQLELLNFIDLSDPGKSHSLFSSSISESEVALYQEKYVTYYYNAWQNDDHQDPIQSLLFNLIHDYQVKDDLKDKIKKSSKQIAKDSVISSVKTLSQGFVDLESLKTITSIKDLAKDITTSKERKDAISNIIDAFLPDGKKVLFLIDELDRCAPSFAVGMLEAIKHYYNNDKVVFMLATNNSQLAHTVKKYYGNDFDGANYLNKFYDLVLELPEIDRKAFITRHLKRQDDSYWYNIIPERIADGLDMTMREITRYYASLDVVGTHLTAQSNYANRVPDMIKYLFIPVALGLKIADASKYSAFRTGHGHEIIKDLFAKDPLYGRLAMQYVSNREDRNDTQALLQIVLDTYTELFSSLTDRENFEMREQQKRFQSTISLINATGKIDS